jgi:hypothetical protein
MELFTLKPGEGEYLLVLWYVCTQDTLNLIEHWNLCMSQGFETVL